MADEQPEGSGAEGAPNSQGAAPGAETPQDKPWWEARGFQSQEEALNAWDEGRRALTETQTKVATMEKTLQAVMTAAPKATNGAQPPKAEAGYRRYAEGLDLQEAYASGDPNKLFETFAQGMDRIAQARAQEIFDRQSEARDLRAKFYQENKDLAPHEELVKLVSQQFSGENPDMTVGEAYKEIARRVREKIAAIKKGGSVPVPETSGDGKPPKETLPHTGAGGLSDGGGAAPEKKIVPERDDVSSEVNRRVAEREKRRVLR